MLNYDLFAEKIIKKYQKHIPKNFSQHDLLYVSNTTSDYIQTCGTALNKDYNDEFDDTQKEYISEMVAKWVFLKSIELIKDNVPQDKWDNILQNIAYTVFELAKDIIAEQKPKGIMTGYVEVEVFKVYGQLLQDEGIINSAHKEDYKTRLDNFENYSKLGDDEWNKYNYNEAILNYEHALDIIPNHTGVLNQVACAYNELGNYEKALTFSDKAISLLVENTGGYIYDTRAVALAGLKKYSEALADFDKAISIENTAPVFFINKGKVLKETDDINGALECFNQAIELFPQYAQAYEQRGLLYWEQDNPQVALYDFKKALDIEPNYNIEENLANIYNEIGEYKKSKNILDSLISHFPFDKNLYILQARNFINLDKLNEAIINLDNAINIDNDNAEAYYIRGLCNFNVEDYNASISDFNKAISSDSDYANYDDIKKCTQEAKENITKSKSYKRLYFKEAYSSISFWQNFFIKQANDGNVLYYSGFFSDGYICTSEEQIKNFRKFYNKIIMILLVLLVGSVKLHLFKVFKYFKINYISILILLAVILLINCVFNAISVKFIFRKAIKVKEKLWVNNFQTMKFLKSLLLQIGVSTVLSLTILFYACSLESAMVGIPLGMTALIGLIAIISHNIKRTGDYCLTKEKNELNIVASIELKKFEDENKSNLNYIKLTENIKTVIPFITSLLAESKLDYITKVNNLKDIITKIVKYSKTKSDTDLGKAEYRNELVYNVLSSYHIVK